MNETDQGNLRKPRTRGGLVTPLKLCKRWRGVLVSLIYLSCSGQDHSLAGGALASGTVTLSSWWDSPSEKAAVAALIEWLQEVNPKLSVVVSKPTQAGDGGQVSDAGEIGSDLDHVNAGKTLLEDCRDREFELVLLRPEFVDSLSPHILETVVLPNDSNDSLASNLASSGSLLACAVPIGVHKLNNLLVNNARLEKLGLVDAAQDWSSVEELLQAVQTQNLKIAISTEGWAVNLFMFENVMLALEGEQRYRRFWQGDALRASPDQDVEALAESFGGIGTSVVSEPDLDPIRGTLAVMKELLPYFEIRESSDDAWNALVAGEADLMVTGDWRGPELSYAAPQRQRISMRDFPGTEGTKVFTVDAIAQPINSPTPGAAEAVLLSVQSTGSTDEFLYNKGATPVRRESELGGSTQDSVVVNPVPGLPAFTRSPSQLDLQEQSGRALQDGDFTELERFLEEHYCDAHPEGVCPRIGWDVSK